MKTRTCTPVALILALLMAVPALAGQRRRTWLEHVRDFSARSLRSVGREFQKAMAAMHRQTVAAREGAANAVGDLTESGRKGIQSVRNAVAREGRRAFHRTHDTLTGVTQSLVPVGTEPREAAPTIVAREITSPVTDPLFLRRNDIVLAWRTSTGGRPIRRSMILDDRVLFEDTAGELYSFDPGNGIAQWVYPLPQPSQYGYRDDPDHVFVLANDTIYELDRRVGLPRRRIPLPFPASTRPAFGEGIVVIGSWERRVYCMDREKRVKLWNFIPIDTVESSPGLAPGLVLVAETSGKLSAYSPGDHRTTWEYKADDAIRVDLVVTDSHIIFPAEDLYVHCLNRFGGFRSWKFPVRGYVRQPVWATDDVCYFSADGDAFYAVNIYKGSLLWRVPKAGWPVAVGSQNIYLQGPDKEIWAIDRKTGEQVWSVSAQPFDRIARNTDSDHIYLSSAKGDIYALYLRGDHLEKVKPKPPTPKPEPPEIPGVEKPTEKPEAKPPAVPVEPSVPGVGEKPKPAAPKPKPKPDDDWEW